MQAPIADDPAAQTQPHEDSSHDRAPHNDTAHDDTPTSDSTVDAEAEDEEPLSAFDQMMRSDELMRAE